MVREAHVRSGRAREARRLVWQAGGRVPAMVGLGVRVPAASSPTGTRCSLGDRLAITWGAASPAWRSWTILTASLGPVPVPLSGAEAPVSETGRGCCAHYPSCGKMVFSRSPVVLGRLKYGEFCPSHSQPRLCNGVPPPGATCGRGRSFSWNVYQPFLRLGEGHQDRHPIVLTLAWPFGFW